MWTIVIVVFHFLVKIPEEFLGHMADAYFSRNYQVHFQNYKTMKLLEENIEYLHNLGV